MSKEGLHPVRTCDRCTAIKPDGTQCGRTTCVIGPMCWQHTQQHYKVRVKPAKYGMGLFAEKIGGKPGEIVFKQNDFICWYAVGKKTPQALITTKEGVRIPYALGQGRSTDVYNPYKTNDFPGRYANDPNDVSDISKYSINKGNAKTIIGTSGRFKNTAYLRATKVIRQGEEILHNYGRAYWRGKEGTNEDYTGVAKRTKKKPVRYGQ